MGIFDSSSLDMTQQLKNKVYQTYKASNNNSYKTKTLSYIKMYKRTQFSMNISIQGVQPYLGSRFKPNILNTTVTIKANGILRDGESSDIDGNGPFPIQYTEFYLPAQNIMQQFINDIFTPSELLLTNSQSGADVGGQNVINIVNDTYKNKATTYDTMSLSHSNMYKLYYPATDSLMNKMIGLNVSAQDKVYSLSKTLITG